MLIPPRNLFTSIPRHPGIFSFLLFSVYDIWEQPPPDLRHCQDEIWLSQCTPVISRSLFPVLHTFKRLCSYPYTLRTSVIMGVYIFSLPTNPRRGATTATTAATKMTIMSL